MEIENNDKRKPIDVARSRGKKRVVKLLLEIAQAPKVLQLARKMKKKGSRKKLEEALGNHKETSGRLRKN